MFKYDKLWLSKLKKIKALKTVLADQDCIEIIGNSVWNWL